MPQQVGHNFYRIRRQRGLEHQDICGEFLGRRDGLNQSFRLSNHPKIVFQSKNFAQPRTEDCLGIGQDHTNGLPVVVALVRLVQIVFQLD